MESVDYLFVVIDGADEALKSAALDAVVDQIVRRGSDFGVFVWLIAPTVPRSRAVEFIGQRVALKTVSAGQSRDVVGVGSAVDLGAHQGIVRLDFGNPTPFAFLKADTGEPVSHLWVNDDSATRWPEYPDPSSGAVDSLRIENRGHGTGFRPPLGILDDARGRRQRLVTLDFEGSEPMWVFASAAGPMAVDRFLHAVVTGADSHESSLRFFYFGDRPPSAPSATLRGAMSAAAIDDQCIAEIRFELERARDYRQSTDSVHEVVLIWDNWAKAQRDGLPDRIREQAGEYAEDLRTIAICYDTPPRPGVTGPIYLAGCDRTYPLDSRSRDVLSQIRRNPSWFATPDGPVLLLGAPESTSRKR